MLQYLIKQEIDGKKSSLLMIDSIAPSHVSSSTFLSFEK